jgi:hypothetical protein
LNIRETIGMTTHKTRALLVCVFGTAIISWFAFTLYKTIFVSNQRNERRVHGSTDADLGTVLSDRGTRFHHTFDIEWNGPKPFVLGRVTTPKPCCTKVSVQPERVVPGQTIKVSFEVYSKDGPGINRWQASLYELGGVHAALELTLEANIVARLQFHPSAEINLGTIRMGQETSTHCDLVQIAPKEELYSIPDSISASDDISIRQEGALVDQPFPNSPWTKRTIPFHISATPKHEGVSHGKIAFDWKSGSGKPERHETINVTWDVQPSVRVTPSALRVNGSALQQFSIEIRDLDGRAFTEIDTTPLSTWFDVSPVKLGQEKVSLQLVLHRRVAIKKVEQIMIRTNLGPVKLILLPGPASK